MPARSFNCQIPWTFPSRVLLLLVLPLSQHLRFSFVKWTQQLIVKRTSEWTLRIKWVTHYIDNLLKSNLQIYNKSHLEHIFPTVKQSRNVIVAIILFTILSLIQVLPYPFPVIERLFQKLRSGFTAFIKPSQIKPFPTRIFSYLKLLYQICVYPPIWSCVCVKRFP